MPYSKPSDAPDHVPADKKAQWVEVWNSVYKAAKADGKSDEDAEGAAFKQANGVVKKASEKKGATMKREVRYAAELRLDSQGDEMAIGGYAALYNKESKDLGGFRETIAPGAFNRSLKDGAEVKALVNHDMSQLLGRTKNGTLTLSQDERGLRWRAVLNPESQAHRDLYASVKRGDMDECSFAFTVADGGQQWAEKQDREGGDFYAARTLTDVNLMDVSVVTYPAYEGTNAGLRTLFPDGELAEIRSAVDAAKAKAEKRDEDSYEEQIQEISKALKVKYPATYADGTPVPAGYDCGQYWIVETFDGYVIVCDYATGDYFKISYHEDESKPDSDDFLFGEPEPVEKQWVPAGERGVKRLAEYRTNKAAFDAAKSGMPENRAVSVEHEEGDCGDAECTCQNRMVSPDEVWTEEDDEQGDADTDDVRAARAVRKAAKVAEYRAKGDKVRTKSVGGKNLTKDKFAYVGDPERTETWKLPIHDASHVRNALARFNQTKGIPAAEKAGVYRKIKAAAGKFGIHVSDDDSRSALQGVPLDALEIAQVRQRVAESDVRAMGCDCPCAACRAGNCADCDCDGCSSCECDGEECGCAE